jgi:fibronectin-binding autotransporter adhesin
MKSKNNPLQHLGFMALAFAGFSASSAYADTALTAGHTIIDTTGNPELGVISRAAGATALFNNNGTATATGTPLVNGILGPWAFIGTGTATRYATLDGSNNVVGYTAGTSTTWGGTLNSTTTNYEISAAGTATYGGSERSANTIRYTGGAGTAVALGNTSPAGLTVNGIINAGTAVITFNHGGGAYIGAGIHIGSTNELVLNAANAAITVNARIHNNGATQNVAGAGGTSMVGGNASAVTVIGTNTVTFSQANTYTGATTINGGTLALSSTGSLASTQITAASGATFDVSAVSGYTLGSGKTLTNNGTVNGSFTVASGATLNGSGTFNNAVTVNGALNPGNSPGTQTYGAGLTLGAASTTTMEIAGLGGVAGTDFDYINVTGGTLTFDGTLAIVDFGGFDISAQTGTYNLFDMVAGAGDFDAVIVDGNALTYSVGTDDWSATVGDATYNFAEGNGVLSVTVVPEPTAALMGGLGLLGLLRRRRVA